MQNVRVALFLVLFALPLPFAGSASAQSASTQSASTQSASTQSASTQSASTQSASTQSASTQGVETLILFDAAQLETPESIVFDRRDNAYISLAFTGEIRKVARDGTQTSLAFLPINGPCPPAPAVTLGLAMDFFDRLYVAVTSCDQSASGVYRVDRHTGDFELIAPAPPGVVLNGIDVVFGRIYAADTFGGKVWRADLWHGEFEVWSEDPLLARPPGSQFPGPNGLRFFRGEIYVANSSTGDMVAIPFDPFGAAGDARVFATLPFPQGCDEFAFDVRGSIYCTTDPFNTVIRLDADGTAETLLTEDDLLDGPTSCAFGRRGQNRFNLYITNAAFPQFTTMFRPSLMRLRLDIPGSRF